MNRGPRFGGGGRGGISTNDNFSLIEGANAAAARATREAKNRNVKCRVLASNNVYLSKFKRLAMEIKKLKSKRPNAVDTVHSAANIAHVTIQSEMESGPVFRGTGTFFCLVQFDGVNVSVSSGLNKRSAKIEAFEIALEKLMKPHQRVIETEEGVKEFQAADYDYSAEEPRQLVVKPTSAVVADISGEGGDNFNSFQKESNVEAIVNIKKKSYFAKELGDFVLVEPEEHNSSVNGASILRRSADFSKMLLEYDFGAFGIAGNVRCVLKLEGQVLADVVSHSKVSSKIVASQKAIDVLRDQCWTILTKQVHDSSGPEITKDEMFEDLASCLSSTSSASMSVPIADSNKGKKLLQKMGWTGGGIGKDGAGIEEPVSMKQVINREGLGLEAQRGITGGFRSRITELLENYASSERQDDLVFSPHFRKEERIIIHNECRRLNLKSKSNGQGHTRYLIVRRKRSACQLLQHVMQCGGETARYKVVPPGERNYPWRPMVAPGNSGPPANTQTSGGKKVAQQSSASTGNIPSLLGNPLEMALAQGIASNLMAQMGQGGSSAMMAQNSTGMMAQNSPGMAQNGPGLLGQNTAGMQGQNMGMMGQNGPANMMGQNMGMMGQNMGMMGQNGSANMMGQNVGMMGQNGSGNMGQNGPVMMGQNMGMMGQSGPAGMMGQNMGMMGSRGHNGPAGMAQSNSPGMMGQKSGLLGSGPAQFQGQQFY